MNLLYQINNYCTFKNFKKNKKFKIEFLERKCIKFNYKYRLQNRLLIKIWLNSVKLWYKPKIFLRLNIKWS